MKTRISNPAPRLLRLCAILLCLGGAPLHAYDNDNLGRSVSAGPHRTINRLAIERFVAGVARDPVWSRYDFRKGGKLTGIGVIAGGLTHANWSEGERKGTWAWWVEEGGYTADEPELYASFRHFYDPKAAHGATWLTDHLEDLEYYFSFVLGNAERVVNPQIDARDWAIEGPANYGLAENGYCWNKGLEYMRQAFQSTRPDKDRLFVKAWRALGETMHLLADMTCVPHVRNDSHPAKAIGYKGDEFVIGNVDPNQGLLRSDPYETLTREALIEGCGGAGPVSAAGRRIEQAKDVKQLFYGIAEFTQDNFFSADTVSGTDRLGRPVTSASGKTDYPGPTLAASQFDSTSGYYRAQVAGRDVRLVHETWLGSTGWGHPMHAVAISSNCVRDQAAVLIPVAVAANRKLLEWYVPRVEVKLTDWDPAARILRGAITHQAKGAYSSPLVYNSGPSQFFNLTLDGSLQDWDKVRLEIRSGQITADLSRLALRDGQKVRLELDIGGLAIRSNELPLGSPPKAPPAQTWQRYVEVSFHIYAYYDGSFWNWSGGKEQAYTTRDFGWSQTGIPVGSGGAFSGSRRSDDVEQTIEGRLGGDTLTFLKWCARKRGKWREFTYEETLEISFRDIPYSEPNGSYYFEGIDLDTLRPVPDAERKVPEIKHEIKVSDGRVVKLTSVDWTRHGIPRGPGGGADLNRLIWAPRPQISIHITEIDQNGNPRP